MARLALAEDQDQMAFDFFAWAARGRDRAAAEARLELADLALETGSNDVLHRVQDLLMDSLPQWRGDSLALEVRVRLARIAEDLGDIEVALRTMSSIERDHAGTPEADLASDRIDVISGYLASLIESGSMPLPEAIKTFRNVEPYLGLHSNRIVAQAALAGQLEAAGLKQAADARSMRRSGTLSSPETSTSSRQSWPISSS